MLHQFVKGCGEIFGFLVQEFGFRGPEVTVESDIHVVTVTYYKSNLALEFVFEEKDMALDVNLVRLEKGVKPSSYKVDRMGHIIRISLIHLLIEKKVSISSFFQWKNKSVVGEGKTGIETDLVGIEKELSAYAEILKKYGWLVLDDSHLIFNEIDSKKWKQKKQSDAVLKIKQARQTFYSKEYRRTIELIAQVEDKYLNDSDLRMIEIAKERLDKEKTGCRKE
ncbi:hypothetical protein HYR99_26850 [Candidatus Poribacteria bacterium]|nr:hypothetical protein [Candidatus Poribacteria bacterium]